MWELAGNSSLSRHRIEENLSLPIFKMKVKQKKLWPRLASKGDEWYN